EAHELLRLRLRFMTRGRALGREEWLTEGGGARALGGLRKQPGTAAVEGLRGVQICLANPSHARSGGMDGPK
ncbi:MAG: hypothetical protein JJU00_12065, partial [Opitutales bacterium]|nr:hypothetical protein [Opitutales bacterium]